MTDKDWLDPTDYRCSFCKSNKPMDNWGACKPCAIFWTTAAVIVMIFVILSVISVLG